MIRETHAFRERVKFWIKASLRSAPLSFGALVSELPGVDPVLVASTLAELAREDGPTRATAATLIQEARRTPARSTATRERPVPHPLDFYWAYTAGACDSLLDDLTKSTTPKATIAYLGTPNVFRSAAHALSDRSHVLLDRKETSTATSGRIINLDLLYDSLPDLGAQSAVLDPPWYPDYMRSFLWAAACLVEVGGYIWTSMPPAGTRDTADQENVDLLEWAASGGLDLVERRTGAVRYQTPPFERASHRAAGLGGIPGDWRVGDLAQFELRKPMGYSRPDAPNDQTAWHALEVDGVPIWIRKRLDDGARIDADLLRSITPDDVLHTVSRRDPIRAEVDLWTSLNGVWGSSHPSVLRAICEASITAIDPVSAVAEGLGRTLDATEQDHVRTAADDLSGIVQQEREEHGL